MLSLILSILYGIIVLTIAIVVIAENRNPIKAISWVVVVLLVPIVGIVFYFLFGQDLRHVSMIHRKVYHRLSSLPYSFGEHTDRELIEQIPVAYHPLVQLCKSISNAPLLPVDEATLFVRGRDKFESLLRDIEQASHHIHLEYYAFDSDELGERFASLLIKKAKEGVKVRVLYDDVGSWKTKGRFLRRLRDNGIQIYPFMKVVFPFFTSKVNYRNHRKLTIIDGRIGYIGGMNIANRYYKGNELGPWRDTHVRITGPAVSELQSSFLIDWYLVTRRVVYFHDYFLPEILKMGNRTIPMQLVLGTPFGAWRSIEQAVIGMILRASHSVYIETPYFLPTATLNHALTIAALGGLDVRLILPGKGDSLPTQYASLSYIEELLMAGVKVYLYKDGFLHSKLLTIDNELSFIGSANMDFRSFEHNFESTALFYSDEFAERVNANFFDDLARSEELDFTTWSQRSRIQKLKESFFRLFSPLL
ncbi:cardiolipin synthase [Porphyromonas circumdentaria]|uniref:cardiolipin synthase n=1 Tax=Porphyromonas circumdentaria TaxID=29524 RepID=UPI0026DCB812|nr:cardiolipin synthase [Porphyromonas circumdentaria]MDO4723003.1 cardiolipin synthase [Porphyromonas circumdentaria]